MNLQRRVLSVLALLFCFAAVDAAPLLNVDYAVGLSSPKTGPAAIGLSPADFWNSSVVPNIPGSLKWSDGTPSGAGLTVENGGGVWGTDSTDPMLHTYRYPSSHTGNVVSRFTSFPSGTYDVYVYAHGAGNENGVVELIVGEVSLGTQTTSTNATWDTPGWTEGNEYVVFHGVTIGTNGNFQVVSKPSADGTAVINGIQILKNPAAPVITKQPLGGTAFEGDTVILSVEATGTNLTYQWRQNGVPLDGKTEATLEIANFGSTNVGTYSVLVKNDTAETLSKSAGWGLATRASGQLIDINYTAHLNPTFSVKTGPAAIGVATNDFWNVYSRDVSSLTDWRSGGVVSGLKITDGTATTASLTVTNAGGAWVTLMGDAMMQSYLYPLDRSGDIRSELAGLPAQRYDVYVYAHGRPPEENALVDLRIGDALVDSRSTSSQPGWDAPAWVEGNQFVVFRGVEVADGTTLQVISHGGEAGLAVINGIQLAAQPSVLKIVTQPESQTATNSQQITFSVTADGPGTLAYQWFKNGVAITGATNQQFTIDAAVVADAGRYAARVQNDSVTAVSHTATLTVDGAAGGGDDGGGGPGPAPSITITQQPVGGTFFENDAVILTVAATGDNLKYQWLKGVTTLDGKTNATLEIPSFSVAEVGNYSVIISSGASSVTSAQASLTLAQRSTSHVLNVDYTAHLNPAFTVQTGPAAIGNNSNDFWNVYSRDTTNLWAWRDRGTVTDLKWADGSSSGIALSVTNAMGAWLSAPIDAMFTSYLYPLGPGSITSALQNLPDGKYDFYVYAHGQPDGENAAITLNVDGVDAATLSTSAAHGWNTPDWVEGNQYVVFRGIEVASGTVVEIVSSGGRSGLAVINGLQLSVTDLDLHMTSQPVSQKVTAGDSVTFSASAEGSGTLTYQWFKDGTAISGATSNQFTIAHATGSDAATYHLRVQNGGGTLFSHGATLTIDTLGATTPVINTQPVGGTFFAGDHVALSVNAAGTNLTYQWKKDDVTLDAKTDATLDIGSFTNSDVGFYAVTVSNIAGATNSSRVALALATRANGPVLSVNYTAHLNPAFRTKTGPAAIGVASGDFWNVYSRDVGDLWDWQEGGSVSNLKWTDGSDSGVTLSVNNAQGAWFTFSEDAMMQSYLYPLGRSGEIVSTLTNLPAQKYDIYVYAHGQPDSENAEIVLKVGGSALATNSTSSLPGWVGPAWVAGNQFVLFPGVDVAAGQTVEIISRGGVSGLAVINGLQLAGPAPMFTSALRGRKAKAVEFSTVGTPKLRLQGRADAQYTVYVSADGVNWTQLGKFQAVNGLIDIVDSSAEGQGVRYYKAVLAE